MFKEIVKFTYKLNDNQMEILENMNSGLLLETLNYLDGEGFGITNFSFEILIKEYFNQSVANIIDALIKDYECEDVFYILNTEINESIILSLSIENHKFKNQIENSIETLIHDMYFYDTSILKFHFYNEDNDSMCDTVEVVSVPETIRYLYKGNVKHLGGVLYLVSNAYIKATIDVSNWKIRGTGAKSYKNEIINTLKYYLEYGELPNN